MVEPHGRRDTAPILLAAGVAAPGILWTAAAASALLAQSTDVDTRCKPR